MRGTEIMQLSMGNNAAINGKSVRGTEIMQLSMGNNAAINGK